MITIIEIYFIIITAYFSYLLLILKANDISLNYFIFRDIVCDKVCTYCLFLLYIAAAPLDIILNIIDYLSFTISIIPKNANIIIKLLYFMIGVIFIPIVLITRIIDYTKRIFRMKRERGIENGRRK